MYARHLLPLLLMPLLGALLFAGYVFAGYQEGGVYNTEEAPILLTDGELIDFEHFSPDAQKVNAALAFITAVFQSGGCSGGGPLLPCPPASPGGGSGPASNPSAGQLIDSINTWIDEDRINKENAETSHYARDHYGITQTEPGHEVPLGSGSWWVKYDGGVSVSDPFGTPPGINLDEVLFGENFTSTALLAQVLVHEAGHVFYGQGHENATLSEQYAFQLEGKFICCALGYLRSLPADPMNQLLIEHYCSELGKVRFAYYCQQDGEDCKDENGNVVSEAIPDCGCGLPAEPCVGDPPPPGGHPPFGPPPRPLLLPYYLPLGQVRYATAADYWKANLNPFTRELEIVRRGGEGVDSWTFDLTSQVEGDFQPLTMVGGQTAELYVAGRIDGADGGIVYRVSVNWDGSNPNPSLECVLFSPSVGDVTSMVFHGTYNNSLVMFDYTNARLIRLNLLTQALAVLADSASYPQLLGQASVLARIRYLASTGAPVGVAFFLQSGLEYDLLASAHGKSILVMRIANDGTVETVDQISF